MERMENELSTALTRSISGEAGSVISDILEAGLDSVMDDGLLKEIPILSIAVRAYKIGSSINERHYLKKLAVFVQALNNDIIDEEKREYFQRAINSDPKRRNKELEYILVLLDRYIHFDKAEKLAKFFLAYLDENIDWTTFAKTSEVLDRFLPGDYRELLKQSWLDLDDSDVPDSLLRLISLGLVISHNKSASVPNTVDTVAFPAGTIKDYELTDFGKTFLKILAE